MKYVDPDGKSPISLLVPNPEKTSTDTAKKWIDENVCNNTNFPICQEMYKKSRNSDSSDFVKDPNSYIAKEMATDKGAYVNKIIPERLKNGKTSGKNGQTGWTKNDLKLSIGSATFSWELKEYDSKTKNATVEVHITDEFDFNAAEKRTRSNDAEKLTALGRKAELTSYKVNVKYFLKVKVEMPGEN